jgi:hypothetical protein
MHTHTRKRVRAHTHARTHRAAKLISIGSTHKAVTSSQYLKHYIHPLPPGSSTHIHRVLLIHQILNPLNNDSKKSVHFNNVHVEETILEKLFTFSNKSKARCPKQQILLSQNIQRPILHNQLITGCSPAFED